MPNLCSSLLSHFEFGPSSCCQFLVVMCKHDVIHKPEVHNVSQRRQRMTEPRPYVTCINKAIRCTADSAPGSRHPLHDGLVQCWHLPSSRTRHNQYDAAGALASARRRNGVTRCNGIDMPPCDRKYTTYRNARGRPSDFVNCKGTLILEIKNLRNKIQYKPK